MIDEIEGVLFTDGRCRIFLHPPRPYPDGHGFRQLVDMTGGPFHGTIEAVNWQNLGVLRSFHRQLLDLYQKLKGKAELSNSYENLKISLEGDGRGHMTVYVEARAGPTMNVRFSFDFQVDQTELRLAIDSMERSLLKDLQADR